MVDIRTGPDAADTMASWKTYPARQCLNAVSRAFQRGDATHSSEVLPLVEVTNAADHWAKMPEQYKHSGSDAPKGAVVQMGGGSGHIFLSVGGGRAVSTDYPNVGEISEDTIENILHHFSGNSLLGWGEWINGRAIEGIVIPVAPKPTPAPAKPVPQTVGSVWETNPPDEAVQKRIQVALAKRGRYQGPQNGIFGENTWRGIQYTVSTKNGNTYIGLINGIPGKLTCVAIQEYAKKYGGYTGPINAILGPNGWEGFARGLEKGLA